MTVSTPTKTVSGRIVGVQPFASPQASAESDIEDLHLVILGDNKQISHHDLRSILVSYSDPSLQALFDQILKSCIENIRNNRINEISIHARGTGERQIVASYVIESPVYKMTYRFLLRDNDVFVQACAIIDNPCECDLNNIDVAIVSGKPISFKHDLYSARFMERPEQKVDIRAATNAPLEATMVMRKQLATKGARNNTRRERTRIILGGGSTAKRHKLSASRTAEAGDKDLSHMEVSQAKSEEIGELFEYHVPEKVTIRERESALLPLVNKAIEGGKVNVYSADVCRSHTMSAVRIKNTTGAPFENGPVSVFEGTRLLGEGMLKTCRVGGEIVMPYSVNGDCRVNVKRDSKEGEMISVISKNGYLASVKYRTKTTTYTFRNEKDKGLDIHLLHTMLERFYLQSARLYFLEGEEDIGKEVSKEDGEGIKVDKKDGNNVQYCFKLRADCIASFVVREREVIEDGVNVEMLARNQECLLLMVKNGGISKQMHEALGKYRQIHMDLSREKTTIEQEQEHMKELESEQKRYRVNIESLASLQNSAQFKDNPLILEYIDSIGEVEKKIRDCQERMDKGRKGVRESQKKLDELRREMNLSRI